MDKCSSLVFHFGCFGFCLFFFSLFLCFVCFRVYVCVCVYGFFFFFGAFSPLIFFCLGTISDGAREKDYFQKYICNHVVWRKQTQYSKMQMYALSHLLPLTVSFFLFLVCWGYSWLFHSTKEGKSKKVLNKKDV